MRPGSAFVNVSSICGLEPGAGFSVYCATKYAVIGFSKSVALEVGSKGIRVNIVRIMISSVSGMPDIRSFLSITPFRSLLCYCHILSF